MRTVKYVTGLVGEKVARGNLLYICRAMALDVNSGRFSPESALASPALHVQFGNCY